MEEKNTFEESMNELQDIVKKLEDGKIPLENAIAMYERGLQLKQFCEKKLNEAKMRIEKIEIDMK